MTSIAGKIGCSPHTSLEWVKTSGRNSGRTPGVSSDVAAKLKALEREDRELRHVNEIWCEALAYFGQAELDRPFER